MVIFRLFLLSLLFTSCTSAKVLKAKSLLTTFEGDSLLFDALENPEIAFCDLCDVRLFLDEIKLHEKLSLQIDHPTIFRVISTYYIVYPGENITISIGEMGQTIFKIEGNEQRNREFRFQYAFQTLDQKIWPQFPGRTRDYPIDTILQFEQKIKSETPPYIIKSSALFDSLATAYQISNTFKKLSKDIMENRQYAMLHYLYNSYQKELSDNNLSLQKQRELLLLFNNIKDKQKLYAGASFYIESIAQGLKIKLKRIKTEEELRKSIDTIKSNFKSLSRDLLLTKVMYAAINDRIPLSKKIKQYYYHSCVDNEYKTIIKNSFAQKRRYAMQSKRKKDNRLIALSDNKIYTLEEVIAQQKGKLTLIDLWASWCIPCLEQHPYMKKLEQQFAGEQISFIYLSMDKEILKWQQKSEQIGIEPAYSYLFENFNNQSFLKKYKVETIPRYILIDKNGKIINADAPTPDNIELEKLIKEHL